MAKPLVASAPLEDWLAWLETLSPREIDLGLERVAAVLSRLSLPQPPLVLTIGGTNGKGSSVTLLDAMLRSDGATTGTYTSPHLLHYCERIRLDGVPASERQVLDAFRQVESARDDTPLTYFEFGTLAALCVFAAARVDAVVLEVGLGGRLDAVNAVDHDGCIITNVSLDHCDWLGDSVEAIAAEKAGIMRADKVVVFGDVQRPAIIDAHARDVGAELVAAGRDFGFTTNADGTWNWRGRQHQLQGLARPRLHGHHQLQNAAGVLGLVESLDRGRLLTRETVDAAFARADLPGRLQSIRARDRHWLLDGAHNPAGAAALADALRGTDRPLAVAGILGDKDSEGIVRALDGSIDRWIAVAVDSPRSMRAESLGLQIASITGKGCRVENSLLGGLEAAISATESGDTIVVLGSFYTVAGALSALD